MIPRCFQVRRNLIAQICNTFRDEYAFFRGFKENVILPLHLLMRRFVIGKDDVVIREGDIAREVYLGRGMPCHFPDGPSISPIGNP
eukprot:SAG11_NODE_1262_length_5356_cov_12.287807_5_plen_86_part_00